MPEYSPFPGYGPARGEAYLAFIIETVKPLVELVRSELEKLNGVMK